MALERYAWISVGAAVATIALKAFAWWLTGSVGLLSDALESLINLAAALLALSMLRLAASPPDAEHPHGFSKAEYFSAGIEGALIVLAASGYLIRMWAITAGYQARTGRAATIYVFEPSAGARLLA